MKRFGILNLGVLVFLLFYFSGQGGGEEPKDTKEVIKGMVEVSVDALEIKESNVRNLGILWNDAFNFEEAKISAIFRLGDFERKTNLSAKLQALITNNQAQILANPRLITKSAAEASFVVGGQIPVPVVSDKGTSIEWKQYGVNLKISPTITGQDTVEAQISLSVDDLDYANAVKQGGFDVPALLNRATVSKVEIKEGETIVIAGLKQSRKSKTKQKIPILGYIPLLGNLFTNTVDRDDQTSMIVFVTFRIVQ